MRGADIVTTVTADKAYATILTPDMIEPGMHINAVGGDCPGKTELHADVLRGARVFVEYEPQTRIEGDIQQLPRGLPGGRPVARAGRHGAGPRSAPTRSRCSTRSASRWKTIRPCATCTSRRRSATWASSVELVPGADDPKDLFRHTRSGAAHAVMRRVA